MNRRALVAQRESLNTGLMTLGEWFSTHPPLARRMLALEPSLDAGVAYRPTGALKAAMVVALVALPLVGGGILVATAMPAWMKQMQAQVETAGRTGGAGAMTAEDSMAAHAGLDSLGRYMEARRAAGSQLPRERRGTIRALPGGARSRRPARSLRRQAVRLPDGRRRQELPTLEYRPRWPLRHR